MDILTYKTGRLGNIHAAYLGTVRVGYVEHRQNDRWIYQTNLLRPEGGAYFGKEDTEEAARAELERSVQHWIQCAKLRRAR